MPNLHKCVPDSRGPQSISTGLRRNSRSQTDAEMIHEYVEKQESFAFENTLGAQGCARPILRWQ